MNLLAKIFLPAASLLLGILPAGANAVYFDGQTYVKAFEKKSKTASVTEYLPSGETLKSWNRLVAFRTMTGTENPKLAAMGLIRALKHSNPQAQSAMFEHPASKDVIVDFVTWPADGSFIEFNIFRYSRQSGGKGLLLQQYAQRAYGDDSTAFLEKLKTERQRLVDVMAKTGLKKTKK
jgi:hypothetical protein